MSIEGKEGGKEGQNEKKNLYWRSQAIKAKIESKQWPT